MAHELTTTVMRALAICLLLLPTRTLAAPAYFLNCEVAFESAEFARLRDHLASAPIQQADKCLRLSNSEFLVTANHEGPYNGPASNLFYCNLKALPASCVEDEPSFYYPELTLVRQFSGPRGKQYVLWSTQLLRRGVWSSGYYIFNLVPRADAPRGYVFYQLGIGTRMTADGCELSDASDGLAIEVTRVNVNGEGTAAVTLAFEQTTASCEANSKSRQTIKFMLRDGKFQRE